MPAASRVRKGTMRQSMIDGVVDHGGVTPTLRARASSWPAWGGRARSLPEQDVVLGDRHLGEAERIKRRKQDRQARHDHQRAIGVHAAHALAFSERQLRRWSSWARSTWRVSTWPCTRAGSYRTPKVDGADWVAVPATAMARKLGRSRSRGSDAPMIAFGLGLQSALSCLARADRARGTARPAAPRPAGSTCGNARVRRARSPAPSSRRPRRSRARTGTQGPSWRLRRSGAPPVRP